MGWELNMYMLYMMFVLNAYVFFIIDYIDVKLTPSGF